MRILYIAVIWNLLLGLSYSQVTKYQLRFENLPAGEISTKVDDMPASNSVTNILIVGDTVWIGTSKGLSMTTDGGRTWKNFYGTPEFGKESISAIAYKDGVIWVATAHSVKVENETLPEGSGLRYSTDGGKTWVVVPQPVDSKEDTIVTYGKYKLRALPITTKVSNIIYDIALTRDAVWIASFAGGLRKSTDMGKTWQRVVLPPDKFNWIKPDTIPGSFDLSPVERRGKLEGNLNHRVFSVIATDDSTIWVGTANGINKSTDGGLSWVKYNHQNQRFPISGNFVVALGEQKLKDGRRIIWASTINAEDPDEFRALSFSMDGGLSWQTTLEGKFTYNLAFRDSVVYAVSDDGFWRTTNFGNTWEKAGTIVDLKTRQRILTSIFYSIGVQNDTIWIGSADGLIKMLDSKIFGISWKIIRRYEKVAGKDQTYAYPNPFSPRNGVTRIHYSIDKSGSEPVTLEILDFSMRRIRTVIRNARREGPAEFDEIWDGRGDDGDLVSNGVYFYRLKIGDKILYGKILVVQ